MKFETRGTIEGAKTRNRTAKSVNILKVILTVSYNLLLKTTMMSMFGKIFQKSRGQIPPFRTPMHIALNNFTRPIKSKWVK